MSLLLAQQPIVVNPELATKVGLHEAIVLQQLNYWIKGGAAGILHEGRRWIYNTLEEWGKQFPFMSESSIKRAFASLRRMGIVMSEKLSRDKHNKTNYYTIVAESPVLTDEVNLTPSNGSICPDRTGQLDPFEEVNLTCSHTETTTEITTKIKNPSCPDVSLPDEQLSKGEFLKRHPDAVVCSPAKRQWGTHDDLNCAQWIWRRVLRLYEEAASDDGEIVRPKEPNWSAWANEVRLMRSMDGRTHKQICEMFAKVQRDPFWVRQVKCPSKLREKWDDLVIRLSGTSGCYVAQRRDVNSISKPDSDIPPGFRG